MEHRPAQIYLLCLLHVIIGITAFAGGAALMLVPDGSLLGMKISWLEHSPFANYFLPGLLLFLFLAMFPFLVLFGLLFKPSWQFFRKFNIYKDKHGGWTYSLFEGIIVLIWIIAQQAMGGFFRLQTQFAALGLLIIILTLLPVVRKYYTIR